MSNNNKSCIFNKNHIIGKKSIENHYVKSHLKEYSNSMNKGWFCRRVKSNIFKDQKEMDKHISKCQICQIYCGEKRNNKIHKNSEDNNDDNNSLIDISVAGMKIIEEKLPKDKKKIDFPTLDLDKYKKIDNKITNTDLELINILIEEEKNLF